MNRPKVEPEGYIQFLVASPRQFTCAEAAAVQPPQPDPPAHDAFRRLLTRLEPDPETLWQEAQAQVRPGAGLWVLDDSTLDKPYARHIELVYPHWSGKHKRVVDGINLLTLLWTDGDRHVPCDWAVYDKPNDKLSKNALFRTLLRRLRDRGLTPRCVCFDGWYGGLDNLKLLRSFGWRWLTRLKSNRSVRLERGPPVAVRDAPIAASGTVVWLPGYGLVKVFRIVARDGDTEHWASGDLGLSELDRLRYGEQSWAIESYHRGLKQHCGAERCQVRRARAQRNHIGFAIRAFLRLESWCFGHGLTWFQAKAEVIRDAVRSYLAQPKYTLARGA
jgi:putative transposase